jgi:hypothetical protein
MAEVNPLAGPLGKMMRDQETYQEKARRYVYEYITNRLDKSDKHITFSLDEVYVVWFTKVLQNWRCLISTTLPDLMYYEVVYDGDQDLIRLLAYHKHANVVFKDFPEDEQQLMANMSTYEMAKFYVIVHVKSTFSERGLKLPKRAFKDEYVNVIWLTEMVQNWKAVAATWLDDEALYEITYDGNQFQTYVDVYKKLDQIQIAQGEDSHGS